MNKTGGMGLRFDASRESLRSVAAQFAKAQTIVEVADVLVALRTFSSMSEPEICRHLANALDDYTAAPCSDNTP